MSLSLDLGTRPAGLQVKTHGYFGYQNHPVFLGDYEISLEDFLAVAQYVLTNTDLAPDDPRLKFVKWVQGLREVDGYVSDLKRLSPEQSDMVV